MAGSLDKIWTGRAAALTRILGAIILLSGSRAHFAMAQTTLCDPFPLMTAHTAEGEVVLNVEADRMRGAPDWKPGDGEAPVSVATAIAAVQESIKKNAPPSGAVRMRRVQLLSASCNSLTDRWYYVVEYSTIAAPPAASATRMTAVLMDGTVVAAAHPGAALPPTASRPENAPIARPGAQGGLPSAHIWPNSVLVDVSHPENAVKYDGEAAENNLGFAFSTMLRAERFDQLEAELSTLLDARQRLPDGRFAYPVVMLSIKGSTQYGEPVENILDKIEVWRTHSPRSRHAPIIEAVYWSGYAWFARGGGYSNTVSDRAWELFRERTARARRSLESGEQYARGNPLWKTVSINLAWDQNRPRAEVMALYVDAVKRDPWFITQYFAVAYRLTPRWGGGIDEYREFVEDGVRRTRATDGATMYARLYWTYADVEFDQPFRQLGIPWVKMKAGFDDLMARYPSPWIINNYASFACRANDKEAFLKLLPKLSSKDIRQGAWPTGYSLENCKETFMVRS